MIFLLASNRHASIACNDSRFYSVVQNSRNVTHIPYINYLCISFCWLLGYSNSFVLAFLFFFLLFSSHLDFQCMNSFSPLKILLGYLFWIEYLILGIHTLAVQESVNGHLWDLTADQTSALQVPVLMTCTLACAPRDGPAHWGLAYFHIGWKLFPKLLHKNVLFFFFIILRKQGMYDHMKMKLVIKTITSNENVYCTIGIVTLWISQWFPW